MKTSKIKNFSLIPTSWYYLPKIPINAEEKKEGIANLPRAGSKGTNPKGAKRR
ncbi:MULTISPECIES: hypothetical protein [unclassified Stygiolobus]|uniref:hypothetical protein n=1 Tax=unclassified Stygiolobus TaxID=2824672 RepID=UPI00307F059B